MRVRAIRLLAWLCILHPPPLLAQTPLRILEWRPGPDASPGDVITITFDRPVSGMVEHSVEPARVLQFTPPFDARVEWRDPSTIRVVPRAALTPGQIYVITVDTTLAAIDGARLAAPARLTMRLRGPRLVTSDPFLVAGNVAQLAPDGRIVLFLSAPADPQLLESSARLQLRGPSACTRAEVRFRVARQRALESNEVWQVRGRMPAFDSLAFQFTRAVELLPRGAVPEGCAGDVVLPSLDPLDQREIRYAIRTAEPFRLAESGCIENDCLAWRTVSLVFSAPVSPAELRAHVQFEPSEAFAPTWPTANAQHVAVATRFAPRTGYRVRIDPSLRDVYGRSLTGRAEVTLRTGDHRPAIGHLTGLITIPSGQMPSLRLRHVNVDSVEIVLTPLPASQRVQALLNPYRERGSDRGRAIRRRVELRAAFNETRLSELALPELVEQLRGQLVSVDVRVHRATRPPPDPRGELVSTRLQELPRVPELLIQVSDLVAHAKITTGSGAVFVTDARSGAPRAGVRVRLFDTRGALISSGTTDSAGLAAPLTTAPPRRADARTRDPWNDYSGVPVESGVIEVSSGDQRTLVAIQRGYGGDFVNALGESRYAYQPWYRQPSAFSRAALFTDRGIYRPGEVVYAAAVVRDGPTARLRAPAIGDSLRWRTAAYSMDNGWQTVRDTVLPLSPFGTSADSFRVSAQARLGPHLLQVAVKRQGRWTQIHSMSYQVAEYRAPEFVVGAMADSAVRFLGDTAVVRVSGRFLFDAPMAGGNVRWSAVSQELAAGEVTIPGLPRGFVVGETRWWDERENRPGLNASGTGTLDASGVLHVRVPTAGVQAARGARVRVDVSVEDVNRQTVTATTSQTMHGSSFYIAVRDAGSGYWWNASRPRRLEVVAVRPDGRRVSGVRVRTTLLVRRWRETLVEGRPSGTWGWRTDTLRVDSLTTTDSVRSIQITPSADGYHQVILSAADDAGRSVRSSIVAYALGGAGVRFGDSPARLHLALSTERARRGDTVTVAFVSPFTTAEAWLTVEREGVLWQRRLAVRAGPMSLPLVIDESFVPNAFVSVLLVNGTGVADAEALEERVRLGYARVDIDRAPKRLDVEVRPLRAAYAPGDSAVMTVSVTDAAGRRTPAMLAVWAVDEGVLSLTGYERPDPVQVLYPAQALEVTTGTSAQSLRRGHPALFIRRMIGYDQFGNLLQNRLSEVVVTGAASSVEAARSSAIRIRGVASIGGAADVSVRQDFRTTAFFRALVNTDDDGTARLAVKLPDNVTTFRLIAVAASAGDRYGSGESPLIMTKPLLIRAALPRFVRRGDELLAGGVVNARGGAPREVTVTAGADGLARADSGQRRLTLAAGGSEARFAWRVTGADSVRVRLAVTDGADSDALEVHLPVRPDYTPRAHALTGVARGTETIRFALPAGIDPERSRLTIRIGTSPMPSIHVAGQYLMSYRYYCTEQLVSAGRYLVSVAALQRAGLVSDRDAGVTVQNLQRVVDQLAQRQRTDGGFGYWSRDAWTTPWLTAHVGLLLLDAREARARVEPAVLSAASGFLVRVLETAPESPDTTYGNLAERRSTMARGLSDRLAAAQYLGRVSDERGRREARRLLSLASYLSWEDRVWLAHLLSRIGATADARDLLERAWSAVGIVGARAEIPDSLLAGGLFTSRIRPPARLLSATLAIEPAHPRIGVLVERLVQRSRSERGWWWNTQDHAAAATALAEFTMRSRGGSGRLITTALTRDGARRLVDLTSRDGQPRDTTVSLASLLAPDGDSLAIPLRFETPGDPVFYALTVHEVPRERNVTPDVRGVSVERWYERFDGGRPVTEVREGELVRVRLRISVPADREFVALEDLLPAGLEAVDLSLRTSRTLGPFRTAESDAAQRAGDRESRGPALHGAWDSGWWSPWEHSEKRDDRVVFFARMLWRGTYTATYIARATTAGRFVRPPAHAEEMYNPAANGRSEGGWFRVTEKRP